jgi:hypothetical protein
VFHPLTVVIVCWFAGQPCHHFPPEPETESTMNPAAAAAAAAPAVVAAAAPEDLADPVDLAGLADSVDDAEDGAEDPLEGVWHQPYSAVRVADLRRHVVVQGATAAHTRDLTDLDSNEVVEAVKALAESHPGHPDVAVSSDGVEL